MNTPEYILPDEIGTIVAATKTALSLPVLNYQYGYRGELNETLKQYEQDPAKNDKKFPLVWLMEEDYDTERGEVGIYGQADPPIFIFNSTNKEWKAKERMANNYIPVLLPIYRELMNQLLLSPVFSHQTMDSILKHKYRKGYFWDRQNELFNDAVDCLIIRAKLRISDKQDCKPFSNF